MGFLIYLFFVLSGMCGLVYEVVCGLGKRVVRTYSQDGRAAKAMTLVGEETL